MSDEFLILPYQVRAAGTDVPPEEVQRGLNSVSQQTTVALNTLATQAPSGPAGGDLSGTYPNPTVSAVHATSGTESGVAHTTCTIDSSPIGQTTPAAGSFTALNGTINSSPIGQTTAAAGAFTTLSATSTVSGAGFTSLFASPPAIGGTAAAAGSFTTLSSTGLYTPSTTNGIKGTTLADNANAGSIGELLTNTTTLTSLTTATPATVATVNLTAGDWDVTGLVQFNPAGTTTTSQAVAGISTTTNAFGTITGGFSNIAGSNLNSPAGNGTWVEAPVTRINVSTGTNVFLIAQATFAVSTMTASGSIRARRVR